jgi:hypothetical protein
MVYSKRIEKSLYTVIIFLGIFAGYYSNIFAQSIMPSLAKIKPSFSIDKLPPAFMKKKVSLKVKNTSIKKVLVILENEANVVFSYQEKTIGKLFNR